MFFPQKANCLKNDLKIQKGEIYLIVGIVQNRLVIHNIFLILLSWNIVITTKNDLSRNSLLEDNSLKHPQEV